MVLFESIHILKQKLSPKASINLRSDEAFAANAARWSDYKAPQPGAVVNVATERDIEETVAWATANGVKFLAQSGGHGWTSSFKIGEGDIIINLRGMRDVTVNLEAGEAVIAAGALVGEVIAEAHKNKAHVAIGVCNSVGAVGSCIGGGHGRMEAQYGMGVDNMISARLVTAKGNSITVSSTENADLWWGLRGAGHSFGIVSSLTIKAYPQINEGMHWASMLIFTPDKIESVAEAINKLDWDQGVAVHIIFACPPPDLKPVVIVCPWYPGPEGPAKQAFSSLLSAGAIMEQSGMTPYDQLNAGGDGFGMKGGQKPVYGTSMLDFDPKALKEVWDLYVSFLEKHPSAGASFAMFECYSVNKVKEMNGENAAFPHRECPYHAIIAPTYTDMAIAPDAEVFGKKFRSIFQNASGLPKNHVYVNFATGDEPREELYGGAARLDKLRALKKKWDAAGSFDHYNPIC